MVFSLVRNAQEALKFRGGWRGLLEAMYTVSYVGVGVGVDGCGM
jgi:hypothetical protein